MRTFRLKLKSYVVGVEWEDGPGSMRNVTHRDNGIEVLWRGECRDEPNAEFFEDVGISMPDNTGEHFGAVGSPTNVGDEEFSYYLEELIGRTTDRYLSELKTV